MMKEKNKVSSESLTFEEEVKDIELHSKLDVDDHIYIRDNYSKIRTIVLIIICGLLILVSLFASIYGFNLVGNKINNDRYEYKNYNLIITHSSRSYGGTITSFEKYDTKEKAYSYDFSVSNSNPIQIKYSVELFNPLYGSDGVNMKLINYSLLKNNKEVKSGLLVDALNNQIINSEIDSKEADNYTIRLWSNKIKKDLSFSFKINVNA